MPVTNIDFVLNELNTTMEMTVPGEIEAGEQPGDLDAHVATVEVNNVSATTLRSIFKFQTDSADIDDVESTDIKYYVDKTNWSSDLINPADGEVTVDPIFAAAPTGKKALKHDFVRYLAENLFNTHYGVDLFTNEEDLLSDLVLKGEGVNVSIQNLLQLSDITNNNLQGTNGDRYRLRDDDQNNFSRRLFLQIINGDKNRLTGLDPADAAGLRGVPLESGDSISFVLTVNPAEDQHLIVRATGAVPSRAYKVKLNLTA